MRAHHCRLEAAAQDAAAGGQAVACPSISDEHLV
jgi:hypothetical protein